MEDIHIMFSMAGKMHSSSFGRGDEDGFALHFTLHSVYPESRVHQAFSEMLGRVGVTWITPHRHFCEIDLDGAKAALPETLRADWIRGRVSIEAEIFSEKNEGLIGKRPETKIILRLIREEILVSQRSRIFLSHKSVNKPMVRRFYDLLESLGFDPWLDEEDMVAGDNLHRGLHEGMRSSCAAVFFITPDFKDEKYLAHEIELAMREKTERGNQFRIITLSMANTSGGKGAVPEILRTYIFKEPSTELEAMREIIRSLPVKVGSVMWREKTVGMDQPEESSSRERQDVERRKDELLRVANERAYQSDSASTLLLVTISLESEVDRKAAWELQKEGVATVQGDRCTISVDKMPKGVRRGF